jgi:hypothetical protein
MPEKYGIFDVKAGGVYVAYVFLFRFKERA